MIIFLLLFVFISPCLFSTWACGAWFGSTWRRRAYILHWLVFRNGNGNGNRLACFICFFDAAELAGVCFLSFKGFYLQGTFFIDCLYMYASVWVKYCERVSIFFSPFTHCQACGGSTVFQVVSSCRLLLARIRMASMYYFNVQGMQWPHVVDNLGTTSIGWKIFSSSSTQLQPWNLIVQWLVATF